MFPILEMFLKSCIGPLGDIFYAIQKIEVLNKNKKY